MAIQSASGLVYVDYPTLERIPKDSFYWYRDLISRGRDVLGTRKHRRRISRHPTVRDRPDGEADGRV